ncbi:MAG: hypothetical protein RL068_326 [Actinomycetota bacterium]|jgi:hypothetical protein
MSTLLALSTLALGFSAINTLIIRDAAIDAAQRSALAQSKPQREYLLRLLDQRLPALASYRVEGFGSTSISGYEVVAEIPGLGLVTDFTQIRVRASATNEAL